MGTAPPSAIVAATLIQPNTPAPDDGPADDTSTTGDSAAAEQAKAAKPGLLGTALTIAAPGTAQPTAAGDSADDNASAAPDADHPEDGKARVAGKPGKAGGVDAKGEAGTTVQTDSPQGDDPTAGDGQPIETAQPDQQDGPAAEKSSSSPEAAHKAAHAHGDAVAGRSDAQDKREGAASVRSDGASIGAVQTAADPTLASATATAAAGAQAGVTGVGSAAATTGAAAPANPTLRTDAGSPAIPVADLGVAIATQAKDGHRSFDIRLDPPELGHIHVRLAFDRDGTVTSHLVVDRADTLDLLRRDAAQLQRALQDAGLKADSQNMQYSLRDQNAGQQDGHHRPHQFTQSTNPESGTRLEEIPVSYARLSKRTGGLDIRI